MIITNKHSLPQAIVEAVKKWTYKPKEHSIGVSALIGPPMQRYLQLKYWDQMSEDTSERLWALLGQAVHAVLDKIEIDETLQEEKLVIPIEGYDIVLSGRVDLYRGETKSVEDFKITSVYSFLMGNKIEWEHQLNTYGFLYRQHGFPVESLKIHAILRDWQKSKTYKDAKYPKIPFYTQNIPCWTEDLQRQYIYDRIADHMRSPVRDCTDEERWYRGEKFAVMKTKRKTAVKLYDNKDDAEKHLGELGDNYYMEHRKGTYVRCEDYCVCKKFCRFARENLI